MKKKIIFIIFLLAFNVSFSSNVGDMKKKIANIDSEIGTKRKKIKNIEVEKKNTEEHIKKLEKEIAQIEVERKKILVDIEVVSKNIEYGGKNLVVSSEELTKKKMEYTAKIIAWSNSSVVRATDIASKPVIKKNYKEILHGDLNRMGHIENVQGSIKEVTTKIEAEKAKLNKLRNKLAKNKKDSDAKKTEKGIFIEKLNKEKQRHQKGIEALRKEKARIEKEIEKVIKARGQTDTKIVNTSQAYSKIGKKVMPVNGKVVLRFKEKKSGYVESNGIEIKARVGEVVKASTNGKVIYADKFQGLGKVVMIDYGYNTIGVYGNLLATKVKLNQKVTKGEGIGVLGLSSEGEPRLYYELRFKLKAIDPLPSF